jgi:hypothetical protein
LQPLGRGHLEGARATLAALFGIDVERSEQPLRTILARMRHEHCGGRAAKAELRTAVDGVSSRPVRRIVLRSSNA